MRSMTMVRTPGRVVGCYPKALVLAALLGCGDIEPVAPGDVLITDPAQLYRGLALEAAAITLSTTSPYNTILLRAMPRDAQGNPMAGLPAPTFRLQNPNDSVRVLLTPTGLATAVATTTGTGVRVIATLTSGSITHVDTARIAVKATADPPKLATLSIEPILPDSAIWSVPTAASILISLVGITNKLAAPRAADLARTADPR